MPGEVPRSDLEVPLDPAATKAFTYNEVWPSVTFVGNGNFLKDARPGEELYFQKTYRQNGELHCVAMRSTCYLDYDKCDHQGAPSRVCVTDISIDTPRPDLTDTMQQAATAGVEGAAHFGNQGDADDEDECIPLAWEVKNHYFEHISDSQGNTDSAYSGTIHYELQDQDGDCLWSDEELDIRRKKDAVDLSQDDNKLLDEMRNDVEGRLTPADVANIQDVFTKLGVPRALFEGLYGA